MCEIYSPFKKEKRKKERKQQVLQISFLHLFEVSFCKIKMLRQAKLNCS